MSKSAIALSPNQSAGFVLKSLCGINAIRKSPRSSFCWSACNCLSKLNNTCQSLSLGLANTFAIVCSIPKLFKKSSKGFMQIERFSLPASIRSARISKLSSSACSHKKASIAACWNLLLVAKLASTNARFTTGCCTFKLIPIKYNSEASTVKAIMVFSSLTYELIKPFSFSRGYGSPVISELK